MIAPISAKLSSCSLRHVLKLTDDFVEPMRPIGLVEVAHASAPAITPGAQGV